MGFDLSQILTERHGENFALHSKYLSPQLPNVLATPHVGYVADDNYRAYFTEAVEDIAAFLAGQPIRRLG